MKILKHKKPASHSQPRRARRKFYVDLDMCGGEMFLEDFDLNEFCEILQSLSPKVQIVPVTGSARLHYPQQARLVSEQTFENAIVRYVGRCALGQCQLS